MIEYKKYSSWDEKKIAKLIREVYAEFVAPDSSEVWNQNFYEYVEPQKIKSRQTLHHTTYLAFEGNKIIWVLESRNMNHISLLFVDKNYHGKGVAKSLLKDFLSEVPKNISCIDVHASPFSIPIYEKLWFYQIGNIKEENGIKYLQMEYKIIL